MKTERRHELQTNQLADWMGHQVDHIKPHTKTILAASILGAAVIIAAAVIMRDRSAAQAEAWTEFHLAFAARNTEALADIAENHPGSLVGLSAKQAQADFEYDRGVEALYSNREEATLALSEARKAYTDVVRGASSYPTLLQKAMYGLARAQEASTNLDAAKDQYQQIVQKFPGTAVAKQAEARLKDLNDPETVQWYSWFGRQKPRPSSRPGMPNLPALPGMPDDLSRLPDSPNLPPAPDGGPLFPPTDVPESAPATPASETPETKSAPESASATASDANANEKKAAEPPATPESPPATPEPVTAPASEPAKSEPAKSEPDGKSAADANTDSADKE